MATIPRPLVPIQQHDHRRDEYMDRRRNYISTEEDDLSKVAFWLSWSGLICVFPGSIIEGILLWMFGSNFNGDRIFISSIIGIFFCCFGIIPSMYVLFWSRDKIIGTRGDGCISGDDNVEAGDTDDEESSCGSGVGDDYNNDPTTSSTITDAAGTTADAAANNNSNSNGPTTPVVDTELNNQLLRDRVRRLRKRNRCYVSWSLVIDFVGIYVGILINQSST